MELAYRLTDSDLMLHGEEKRYTLKVRDLPDEERPREKLVAAGPGALTVNELLAAILVTGTVNEDVLSMSNRILKEYGERGALSATDVKALASDLSIPLGKAAQIVAVGELGRRFFSHSRNGAPLIRTAKDVYEYTVDMRSLAKEHLRGLYLNTHYQLVHDETISIGTLDASLVHPREVFRPALAYAAAGVVLVHNHPSGITAPNESDLIVTRQIAEAGALIGIELIDHVVVTRDSFESLMRFSPETGR